MEGTNTTVPISYPEKKGKYMRMELYYGVEHLDKARRLNELVCSDEGVQRGMVNAMRDRIERNREKGEENGPLENYMYTHSDELEFAFGSVIAGREEGEVKVLLMFTYDPMSTYE